jgi:sterol carrier protein 2
MADQRQVPDVKYALQHNLGLGGACVVTMYARMKPGVQGWTRPNQTADLKKLEQIEAAERKVKPMKAKL